MQITLIRHLPTEWNKKTWLQGRRDIGLSHLSKELSIGIAENQEILKRFFPFDIVLTSTLKRTHQTAGLYGYNYEIEGLLDELDFGPFEGLPKKKLIEVYGEKWVDRPKELILGESLKSFENRLLLFLDKYKDYSNLLVFGHGAWIRAMVSYLQTGDINSMNKLVVGNNACITLELSPRQLGMEG